MANAIKLNLASADDLFSTQEQRDEANLEKVQVIPFNLLDDFPGHPFKVRDDEEMQNLIESVKKFDILMPGLVRPKGDGRYEIVAGHRRKRAGEIAEKPGLPAIVRDMTDEEATIIMVDSNLQREHILPSEKAFAYKMKLDAIKRMPGRPGKDNSSPMGINFDGKQSLEIIGDESGESRNQIHRYIRLTELIPDILTLVDENKIAFRPAVEISYLPTKRQETLYALMESEEKTPSLAQAVKMKQFEKDGNLTDEVIISIMAEEKPNQAEKFQIPKHRIAGFFTPGTKKQEVVETIVKALEYYNSRDREKERIPEEHVR